MKFLPNKKNAIIAGFSICFVGLLTQLISLQLFDNTYKISAENNALKYETIYPTRGRIMDRNGRILVGNKNSYDIMVTPHDVKAFDTLELCKIFSIEKEFVDESFEYYKTYRSRIGFQSRVFLKQVSPEQYSYFIEKNEKFPGFFGIPRSIREYNYNAGGNLLGYITEVDQNFLDKNPNYKQGDFIGRTGIEQQSEKSLKGEKGHKIFLRNASNIIHSSYQDGEHDLPAIKGEDITTTIDAELQNFGELLMTNKVGSLVAIEPSTGEILSMVSSPGIDVSILADISKHYEEISNDPFKPMFNRAVMSTQPPGSVFKIVNALIALQEGIITPYTEFTCAGEPGYVIGNFNVGCHEHMSPTNLQESIMTSCNSYYCHIFRRIIDSDKYGNVETSLDKWREYVSSFGLGEKLGSDFPAELSGMLPSSQTYNRDHGEGRWKSLNIISLAIGQGEIGSTPLHIANLAATIANRGYYRVPHIIKYGENTPVDPKYTEKNYTLIDEEHFDAVIEGMDMAVNSPPNSGATARIAAIPGIDVCGKTGTSENPHGDEHSVFMCFAPKDDPKIAIAVYIENAGFGATYAAPIASLVVEKYLTDSIASNRKWLEERMINESLLHKVPAGKYLLDE